jgi:hypothetical protein
VIKTLPETSCWPRSKEPIVRGSGALTKPTAGFDQTARRKYHRYFSWVIGDNRCGRFFTRVGDLKLSQF